MRKSPWQAPRTMSGEPTAPPPSSGPHPLTALREARWRGEGYADITRLREMSAKHERKAAQLQAKIARIHTRIEKLRHSATLIREKAQKVLERIPEFEQEMTQHERNIQAAIGPQRHQTVGSDVTGLHYRVRRLQQKIVDLQHKARKLEHNAAVKTQKTATLKVRADRLAEEAHLEQQEAENFRKRADRLQLTTEGEAAQATTASSPSETPGLPSPSPPRGRGDETRGAGHP